MSDKKPFAGYHVGQTIWQHASYSKDAWRGCTITSIDHTGNSGYGSMRVKQLEGTKQATLYGGSYHAMTPFGVAGHVPLHTIYLLGTGIGEHFNWRFGTDFEVYTCCTRMITPGKALGFLIIPEGSLYSATEVYKHPAYKTWVVAPNLSELFSFLGNKLPEIAEVHELINGKQKASVPDNIVQAD